MLDFDAVYRENAVFVYKYLFSLTHQEEMAEELTQQTFYEAIRSAEKYRGEAAVSTYLCGIAKNLFKKELTRRAKDGQLPLDAAQAVAASGDIQAEAIGAAARTALFQQIHLLPEKMREVIYLRLAGELSFREIGEILGESETWARVTFYRGKAKLRRGGDAE